MIIGNQSNPADIGRSVQAGRCAAFTLPEILCASMLIAVAVVSIYLGLCQGNTFTQENCLNIRAAQIVTEKMETIRLYTWSELTNSGYIPTSFTNYYYPSGASNGMGVTFLGTLTITNAPLTEGYSNDVQLVTVNLTWNSGSNFSTGSFQHQLQTSTFVAHYGMQNYIYGLK